MTADDEATGSRMTNPQKTHAQCPSCVTEFVCESAQAAYATCPDCKMELKLLSLDRVSAIEGESQLVAISVTLAALFMKADILMKTREAVGYHCFICYNGEDFSSIQSVIAPWQALGVSLWMDRVNIEPGAAWTDAISKAIRKTRWFLVFLGEKSLSHWQQNELRIALQETELRSEFKIIPIVLPGRTDGSNMDPILSTLQVTSFRSVYDSVAHTRILSMIAGIDPFIQCRVPGVPETTSNSPNKYEVCLVFNGEDEKFAESTHRILERAGVTVWFGPTDTVPGENPSDAITEALCNSDCIVVLIGSRSAKPWQSERVAKLLLDESLKAAPHRRRIIPVLGPGAHPVDLPPVLKTIQPIDLRKGYYSLIDAVSIRKRSREQWSLKPRAGAALLLALIVGISLDRYLDLDGEEQELRDAARRAEAETSRVKQAVAKEQGRADVAEATAREALRAREDDQAAAEQAKNASAEQGQRLEQALKELSSPEAAKTPKTAVEKALKALRNEPEIKKDDITPGDAFIEYTSDCPRGSRITICHRQYRTTPRCITLHGGETRRVALRVLDPTTRSSRWPEWYFWPEYLDVEDGDSFTDRCEIFIVFAGNSGVHKWRYRYRYRDGEVKRVPD